MCFRVMYKKSIFSNLTSSSKDNEFVKVVFRKKNKLLHLKLVLYLSLQSVHQQNYRPDLFSSLYVVRLCIDVTFKNKFQ